MIPKAIHQIYLGDDMPDGMFKVIAETRDSNPDHSHRLWGARDAERFILAHYGRDVLKAYQKIDPAYYAARADLLRYLIIHQEGGIYLDGKSRFGRPISQSVMGWERYILTQWEDPNMGRHKAIAHVPGGEFVNWHVIGEAGHPFLKAVIKRVLRNIATFKPWHNVGRAGVLLLTGPIPYTQSIYRLRYDAPYILTTNNELGIEYSAPGYEVKAVKHYGDNHVPVIRQGAIGNWISAAARSLRARLA